MKAFDALTRLIELRGTIAATAAEVGIVESAIRYWLKVGRVPEWRERQVLDAAVKNGIMDDAA